MVREELVILLGIILFSVCFFAFYPSNYGIVDEAAYLSTTYTMSRGRLFYEQAGIAQAPMMVKVDGHGISKYPPGNALFLLPFTAISWKMVFIRGWLVMLFCTVMFALVLAHFRLPKVYALLCLFHPALLLYSRTIMSDMPATLLVLVGFYFFMKKMRFLSALAFGLGVYLRYPMVIIAAAFGVTLLFRKEWRDFLRFSLGMLVSLSALLIFHVVAFKNIMGPLSVYGADFTYLVRLPTLGAFIFPLIIIYPLLLFIPFFSKIKEKWTLLFPVIVYILFHSLQPYVGSGSNFFQSLILNERYMLPVIPLLLVPYVAVIDRMKLARKMVYPIAVLLLVLGVVIYSQHQKFLRQQGYYQRKLYERIADAQLVICNKDIYELVNPYIRYVSWTPFEQQHRLMLDDVSAANQPGKIYLACLARDAEIENLFIRVLDKFFPKEELLHEATPNYFSVWRVIPSTQ